MGGRERGELVHDTLVVSHGGSLWPMAMAENILSLLATTSASNAWCFCSLPCKGTHTHQGHHMIHVHNSSTYWYMYVPFDPIRYI